MRHDKAAGGVLHGAKWEAARRVQIMPSRRDENSTERVLQKKSRRLQGKGAAMATAQPGPRSQIRARWHKTIAPPPTRRRPDVSPARARVQLESICQRAAHG